MIKEVDGVFNDTITNITIVSVGMKSSKLAESRYIKQNINKYPAPCAAGVVFVITTLFPRRDSRSTL